MYKKLISRVLLVLLIFFVTLSFSIKANAQVTTNLTQSSKIIVGDNELTVTTLNDNSEFKEVQVETRVKKADISGSSGKPNYLDSNLVATPTKVDKVLFDKSSHIATLNNHTTIQCNNAAAWGTNYGPYTSSAGKNFSGEYTYTVLSYGGWWVITIPGGYKCAQETLYNPNIGQTNSSALLSFRTSVKALQSTEEKITLAFSTGVLSTIGGLLATAPETLGIGAIAALTVAGGALLATLGLTWEWYRENDDCKFYFDRVRTLKTNG